MDDDRSLGVVELEQYPPVTDSKSVFRPAGELAQLRRHGIGSEPVERFLDALLDLAVQPADITPRRRRQDDDPAVVQLNS